MGNKSVFGIYKTRSAAGELAGLGTLEYEAKRFEGRVKEVGILLAVHADDSDWAKKARELLEQTGTEDISSSTEVPFEPRNPKKSEVDKVIYGSIGFTQQSRRRCCG